LNLYFDLAALVSFKLLLFSWINAAFKKGLRREYLNGQQAHSPFLYLAYYLRQWSKNKGKVHMQGKNLVTEICVFCLSVVCGLLVAAPATARVLQKLPRHPRNKRLLQMLVAQRLAGHTF
jgi:hypothetical protein